MKKLISCILCLLMCITLPCGTYTAFADGLSIGGISIGGRADGELAEEVEEELVPQPEKHGTVPYEKYNLSDEFKEFLVTVDGHISITLIGNEEDYANGDYNEYYYKFYAEDNSYYVSVINLLKTITEYNTNITVSYIDPFDITSHTFMTTYKDYNPKYGDIIISCYANFDGNARTRQTIITEDRYFSFEQDVNGLQKINGFLLEKELLKTLINLRTSRDINVALVKGVNSGGAMDYLRTYLEDEGYKMDGITLKDERLNGYDMIMIVAPLRDITLEEIVLLNNFLAVGGKSIMYFAPKQRVGLDNLYTFLRKWGVSLSEDKYLCTDENGGYFSTGTQLYGKIVNEDLFDFKGSQDEFYIMNRTTPINIIGASDTEVKPILEASAGVTYTIDKSYIEKGSSDISSHDELSIKNAPLITMSQKKFANGASQVITFASTDFITTYFALQNNVSNEDFTGHISGNLKYTASIMKELNKSHRSENSGLEEYAIGLAEMGYDATSELSVGYIETVGISTTAVILIIVTALLLIFNGRNPNGKRKQRQ